MQGSYEMCGRGLMSAATLEVSLLGVERFSVSKGIRVNDSTTRAGNK